MRTVAELGKEQEAHLETVLIENRGDEVKFISTFRNYKPVRGSELGVACGILFYTEDVRHSI